MNSKAAVVGGFILGAFALVVAGILFFGGTRLFATSSRVVVFFGESVSGLDVGSPVTLHGARIGSVERVAVHFSAETMTVQTPVYLELHPSQVILEGKRHVGSAVDYEELVRAGLRAQLSLQSLVTGQLRVDFDFRPGTPAQLVGTIKDVPEIPAIPSDLGELRNQLTQMPLRELAETAREALASVGRLSNRVDAAIDPVTKSVIRTTDAATQTLQTADEAVRRLQPEASTALHSLDSLLVDARHQINARGGELGRTLAGIDRTARQAETLLGSVNGLAEPHSTFRGDLEATARDLAVSASSLRDFAQTVERNPNALLMGRAGR